MPEPLTPEQPASQPTPEVVQTPRQRVEASFKEREQTVYELNLVNSQGSSKWGWEWTPERLAEDKRLQDLLGEQNRRFKEEIVNNKPEVQAWAEIEGKELSDTMGNRSEQMLHGATPSDRAYGEIMIQLARQHYDEAVGNLKRVCEKDASVTTAPK